MVVFKLDVDGGLQLFFVDFFVIFNRVFFIRCMVYDCDFLIKDCFEFFIENYGVVGYDGLFVINFVYCFFF